MSDFLQGCMEGFPPDVAAFSETFCKRCRNTECTRAQGLNDKFRSRVQTQEDRLLHPKNVVTTKAGSRYEALKDFVDMTHQAVRLEIADRRQDWTLPENAPAKFVPTPAEENPAAMPEPVADPPLPKNLEGPPPPVPPTRNLPPPPMTGIMVGGGPVPATKTKPVDNWEVKPKVVKITPGTKIKMGGDQ